MIITIALVVLMLITFTLVFLFVKTIDDRVWLTFLVSIVITPLVYFYGVYPMINVFSNYHHEKYFSKELWNNKPALRYELSTDIVRSKILIGQSKNEVNNMLGNYEWLSWDVIKKDHNSNKWNYAMGFEPGAFNSKKECLELTFEHNKVVAVKLYKEQQQFEAEK